MKTERTPEQTWQSFKRKAFIYQNDLQVKELDDFVQGLLKESLTELEKWERLAYVISVIYKITDIKE